MQHHTITEVCKLTGLNEDNLQVFLKREWITPAAPSAFDDEDVARVRLIIELEHDFGANEEAIPIILHLVDQLHYFRNRLSDFRT